VSESARVRECVEGGEIAGGERSTVGDGGGGGGGRGGGGGGEREEEEGERAV